VAKEKMGAKRKQDREKSSSRRSRAHDDIDPDEIRCGRARWKIENDQHPDNKSYNLEHNFGRSFALAEAMKENEDC